jgi:hypothetical protein
MRVFVIRAKNSFKTFLRPHTLEHNSDVELGKYKLHAIIMRLQMGQTSLPLSPAARRHGRWPEPDVAD